MSKHPLLILSGTDVAALITRRVQVRARKFLSLYKRKPKLAVVIVGDDPASVIYTKKKAMTADSLGMAHITVKFAAAASPKTILDKIHRLNADPTVDGILLQRPLPKKQKAFSAENLVWWIDPNKDVDGFHPENVGRLQLGLECLQPCTPTGIMKLFEHYKISLAGQTVCVVGRSSIVGQPMASLVLRADATLVQCHSQTPDLKPFTRQADILIVGAGRPQLINRTHIKPGAVLVDVGIHRLPDGKLCGDVDFDSVSAVARAITPVPGGVGPLTIAQLMANTMTAAENSQRKSR